MAEVLPLSEIELRLLESLLRHKIRFMVVGLSAAALQGAPVVTEDVDLWFDDLSNPKLMRALVKVGAAYIPPFGYNPPMLGGVGSEPFDVVIRMDGLGEFGMGAEIGISTDKIGARGPMGLDELTSYKWLGIGSGQIRT